MYAFVENNTVTQTRSSLPTSFKNISGFHMIDNPEDYGWYKVNIQNDPTPSGYYESGHTYVYENNTVTRTKNFELITSDYLNNKRKEMVCSNYQARVVLYQVGMIDTIEQIMNSSGVDPLAKYAWEYATEFKRDSPFVLSIGSGIGLTDNQLDQLFEQARSV